jgi:type I restriction enzyme M protein
MVRLSLVNLYLHGFTDPHIVEYDTLTSEERWNETADVILANPPFMSPKGGIKPHKRFSVQATRSEVLFVDYMAEHLSPTGRAAIVVPEGIIFQSGTAYKKLREMLVKTSLIAVVSLPAGVFNPYSGVKTSILILDKRRAKTCDSVLFVKVQNDGYGPRRATPRRRRQRFARSQTRCSPPSSPRRRNSRTGRWRTPSSGRRLARTGNGI